MISDITYEEFLTKEQLSILKYQESKRLPIEEVEEIIIEED